MATIDTHSNFGNAPHGGARSVPYKAAAHFLDREHEFDAVKMGV